MTLYTRNQAVVASAVAAGIGLSSFGAAARAQTIPSAAPDAQALQGEIRRLEQRIDELARADQARIQALSQEVHDLKIRLGGSGEVNGVQAQNQSQDEARSAAGDRPQTGEPRAVQNAFASSPAERDLKSAAAGGPDTQTAMPRVTQNAGHRFAFQSADGQYSIGLTGDIQFDAGAYLDFHARNPTVGPQELSDGVNARRARIGVTGLAFGSFGYALVYDSGNSSDQTPKGIETAQIVYGGVRNLALEIGYSNTFFTLDQATGSNDTLFLERATPSNIATNFNAGDARSNAGARYFNDRFWLGGYVTGPASGDSHTETGERLGAFERLAVQVVQKPGASVHLGVGVDELLRAPNAGAGTPDTLTLSDSPQLRIDPTALLTTGVLGTVAAPVTGGHVLDVETAVSAGPFFWQGEYYRYDVERRGLPSASFEGGYGEASVTLTGETRVYNPQAGAYFRIVPSHPFSVQTGGLGAWEIAGRFSTISLTSGFHSGQALSANPLAIDGGAQRGLTAGLNWYPNDVVRFLLDFDHVDYAKTNGVFSKTAALGAPVGARFNAVSLRTQVAF